MTISLDGGLEEFDEFFSMRVALNLLEQEKSCEKGIAIKRLKAAWNTDYLLKILQM